MACARASARQSIGAGRRFDIGFLYVRWKIGSLFVGRRICASLAVEKRERNQGHQRGWAAESERAAVDLPPYPPQRGRQGTDTHMIGPPAPAPRPRRTGFMPCRNSELGGQYVFSEARGDGILPHNSTRSDLFDQTSTQHGHWIDRAKQSSICAVRLIIRIVIPGAWSLPNAVVRYDAGKRARSVRFGSRVAIWRHSSDPCGVRAAGQFPLSSPLQVASTGIERTGAEW